MRVKIAEHCLELRVADEFLPALQAHYRVFATDALPEAVIDVSVSANATTADGPWGECVLHRDFLHFLNDHAIGWCDFARAQGGFCVQPSNLLNPLGSFLRSICMVLVMRDAQGVCLHGAAVLHHGRAYVFVGPSGAGKSTVARFSPGKTVLSDERVFIKKQGSGYAVFPVPQGGDMQCGPRENRGYPVCGIFNLVQDKTVFLEPLKSPANAAAGLFTVPDILLLSVSREMLLERFVDLAGALPCYALHFLPDSSFWSCLEGLFACACIGKEVSHEEYHTPQIGQGCFQGC